MKQADGDGGIQRAAGTMRRLTHVWCLCKKETATAAAFPFLF